MKHSIRRQITVIFICVLVFILGCLFIVNMGFLERYYFSYKTKDLLDTYNDVDKALQKDTFQDNEQHIKRWIVQRIMRWICRLLTKDKGRNGKRRAPIRE